MYRVSYKKSAIKDIQKLPKSEELKIRTIIADLEKNSRPTGCKKIQGYKNLYRLRKGIYRIIYSIIDEELIIEVFKIAHRKDIYKNI